MTKPDISAGGLNAEPSGEPRRIYLNAEHEKIWEMTKDIEGWQAPGDSYVLYQMGYQNGDVIFEIGTCAGRSAVVEILGARANASRQAIRWFGVDISKNAIARTQETLTKWNLAEQCTLFLGDAATFFEKHSVSPTMVFVDGDHSYEGVKRDIAALSPILAPDSLVLFHDFRNPQNANDIQRACKEWEQTGQIKFIGCFGCSALFITVKDSTAAPNLLFWQKFQAARPRQGT